MLQALLLDLDKTLCDTNKADRIARDFLSTHVSQRFGTSINGDVFANSYITGIYRKWTGEQHRRYMPIIEQSGEDFFRNQLIVDLFSVQGLDSISIEDAEKIQHRFNTQRLEAFNYYPDLLEFLIEIRQQLKLIVITNGPAFSQEPKVKRVELNKYVDHVIIGGLEPEEKPAKSIFTKALNLANCDAEHAIHIGDSLSADIAGANASGITSVWVKHQQLQSDDADTVPNHTVITPGEIPSLINNLRTSFCK